MSEPGSIFFASDLHLGVPTHADSLVRERRFVRWLNNVVEPQAQELYLMGDIFDFWCEWKQTVPRGFVRLLGTLAELADSGLPIVVFSGNHDFWFTDYFQQELGIAVTKKPLMRTRHGKKFYLAHGDGLGPREHGYRRMKYALASPFLTWVYKGIHPNLGIKIAHTLSAASRKSSRVHDGQDFGDREHLYEFVQQYVQQDPSYDYFLFGHRHLAARRMVNERTEIVWLGDWLSHYTYAQFSAAGGLQLLHYEG